MGENVSRPFVDIVQDLINYGRSQGMSHEQLGKLSNGIHTFNELYEFRKYYNALLFNEWAVDAVLNPALFPKYDVHKSWMHNDGSSWPGWFIVSAMLPDGQILHHYKKEDWDLFKIPETKKALFKYDGHSSKDVLKRLESLLLK